ncbi:MAG: methylenetetrahydrofolate reductase [Acutalibacteraceae bacterium]
MSVTYGAGGSNSKRTIEIADHIQTQYQIPALAHLTCVASSKSDIALHCIN